MYNIDAISLVRYRDDIRLPMILGAPAIIRTTFLCELSHTKTSG